MKFLPLVFLFFSVGCISRVVPLKQEYVPATFEKVSDRPKYEVWKSLLHFFSKNGLSIRVSDSTSGLVKSSPANLTWTYENKKGKLNDPEAWVVVERVIYKNKLLPLTSVVGEWDVRIKEAKDGQSYIIVSLANLKYNTPTEPSYQPFLQAAPRSTGVFERTLYDQIK